MEMVIQETIVTNLTLVRLVSTISHKPLSLTTVVGVYV